MADNIELPLTLQDGDLLTRLNKIEKSMESLKQSSDEFRKSSDKAGKELGKSMDDSRKKVKKTNKELSDTEKQTKRNRRGVDGMAKGFNALGLAIKATGIGLLIGLVVKLTDAFSKNQVIMDGVNTVLETVNIFMAQLTGAVTDSYTAVSESTGAFESLGKVMKGLLTLALTPIKNAFYGIKLGLQGAQLAWEKSWLGDGDPETIKNLNKSIGETKDRLKEVQESALEAGVDIAVNIKGAADEVVNFGSEAAKNFGKISVSAANAAASRIVELRNQAKLAQAQLRGLTLEFQSQAESQRQIRDDTRLSIDERIAANDELGRILKQQTDAELAAAQVTLDLANAELAQNRGNVDLQVAQQNALNEISDIKERIKGQTSEQIVNEDALQRERRENLNELRKLGKSEVELSREEAFQKLQANKDLIEKTISDEDERIEYLKKAERDYHNEIAKINEDQRKGQFDKALEAIDTRQELRMSEVELIRQSADATLSLEEYKEQERLKIREKGLKERLELLRAEFGPNSAEVKLIENQLALIGEKLNQEPPELTFYEEIKNKAKAFLGEALGLDNEQVDQFVGAMGQVYGEVANIIGQNTQRQLEANQRVIDSLQNRISQTEEELSKEQELAKQGFANNVQAKEKEIQTLKTKQQQAVKEQEEIRKRQQRAQIFGALATTAANLFKAFSSVPLGLGIPLAIAAIAKLYSTFKSVSGQAQEVAGQSLSEGGEVAPHLAGKSDKGGQRGHRVEGSNLRLGGDEFVVRSGVAQANRPFLKAFNRDGWKGVVPSLIPEGIGGKYLTSAKNDDRRLVGAIGKSTDDLIKYFDKRPEYVAMGENKLIKFTKNKKTIIHS